MKFFNWSEIKHKKTTTNITKKINSQYFIAINDTKHIKNLKSNSYFRKFHGNFFGKKDKESSHLLKLEINLGKIKNKKSKYDDLIKSTDYYSNREHTKTDKPNIKTFKKIILNKPQNKNEKIKYVPIISIDLEEEMNNKKRIRNSNYSENKNKNNKYQKNLSLNSKNIENDIKRKIYLDSLNYNTPNISRKQTTNNIKYNHKRIDTSYIFKNKSEKSSTPNATIKQFFPLTAKKNKKNKIIKQKYQIEKKSLFDNIKSKYIFKRILSNVLTTKIFSLIKYNKKEQKKLNINMNDYEELCKTEIEIIPPEFPNDKFINIDNEIDKKYFHIYFNEDKEETNMFYIPQENVKKIKIIIDYQIKSYHNLFKNCSIGSINFKKFNGNHITNMSDMFYGCLSLKEINFSNFNSKNVLDMSYMFYNCSSLQKLDLTNFDTSNVLKMNDMFRQCSSLSEIDISKFNTKKVYTLSNMFFECSSLKKINISNFKTDKLCFMTYMFFECTSLEEVNISNLDTSKVKDMSYLFCGCSSLNKLDISNFDTSNVIDMSYMFSNCSSLRKLNLSNFDTSKATNMNDMFHGCSSLKEININSFNTTKVIDMSNMFHGCSDLKEINLSNFNTDNVTNINKMFYGCLLLKNLKFGNLNTKNIIDMSNMFIGCPYKLIQEIKSKYSNIKDEAFE